MPRVLMINRGQWLHLLLDCDAIERRLRIETLVAEKIAQILRLPVDKLDVKQGFDQLGVDSLMSVEILAVLQMTFSVILTVTDVMVGASVTHIAHIIDERLKEGLPHSPVVANIDEMDEEALDTLLNQLL